MKGFYFNVEYVINFQKSDLNADFVITCIVIHVYNRFI